MGGNYCFANAVLNNEETFVRDYYDFHSTMAVLNAVAENELSEYAARMMAVEGQLTNIQQLQHHTNYLYNKTRQGSITAALIEILSAISAMEGNASKGVRRTLSGSPSKHLAGRPCARLSLHRSSTVRSRPMRASCTTSAHLPGCEGRWFDICSVSAHSA